MDRKDEASPPSCKKPRSDRNKPRKPHTKATRKKIAESLTGRSRPQNVKHNISKGVKKSILSRRPGPPGNMFAQQGNPAGTKSKTKPKETPKKTKDTRSQTQPERARKAYIDATKSLKNKVPLYKDNMTWKIKHSQ